jgi:hypothetical protein
MSALARETCQLAQGLKTAAFAWHIPADARRIGAMRVGLGLLACGSAGQLATGATKKGVLL